MEAETLSATFAGMSAVAAVATGGIAAYSLVGSRRDSRDRTRPIVLVAFRPGPAMTHGYVYLDVANVGASIATKVKLKFTPAIEEAAAGDAVAEFIVQRYAEPLEVLAPGQHLVNVWSNEAAGEAPLPSEVSATVTYADERDRTYASRFQLRTAPLHAETRANPSGTEYDKRVAKALESLNWESWNK